MGNWKIVNDNSKLRFRIIAYAFTLSRDNLFLLKWVLRISSDGGGGRIFWGLTFLIPG